MLAHVQILLIFTFICLSSLIVNAVLVNVTVDDTGKDPFTGLSIDYSPSNIWAPQPGCPGCRASLDTESVKDGTWHDNTYYPVSDLKHQDHEAAKAIFSFNGSAIYVFCVLSLQDGWVTGYSNMTFYIDDELVGNFIKPTEPGGTGYSYNFMVYANTSLIPGPHTFTLQNGGGGNKSLVLLDYLIYSQDDASLPALPATTIAPISTYELPLPTFSALTSTVDFPQPTASDASGLESPSPVSARPISATSKSSGSIRTGIIGGVVGAVLGALITAAIMWLIRRRKKHVATVPEEPKKSESFVQDISPTPNQSNLPDNSNYEYGYGVGLGKARLNPSISFKDSEKGGREKARVYR